LSGAPLPEDRAKAARYDKEQEEIKSKAEHKESAAKPNVHEHEGIRERCDNVSKSQWRLRQSLRLHEEVLSGS